MQYYFLLRVLVAGICGAMIGYERKSRLKEAGIRTHMPPKTIPNAPCK